MGKSTELCQAALSLHLLGDVLSAPFLMIQRDDISPALPKIFETVMPFTTKL